jgi:CRP-like cAMP-binding protein
MTVIASVRPQPVSPNRLPPVSREGIAASATRTSPQAAPVGRAEPGVLREASSPTLGALRGCAWFSAWPLPALSALAALSSLRSFGPGQAVASDGNRPGAVAVVVKGRVRSVRRGEAGREVTVELFRAGELCLDGLFDAPAGEAEEWIAAETSLLLFVPRDEFLAQVRAVPEAALSLARDLERRLARAKGLAAGLALTDVQGRLYGALARLAREQGEAGPDGVLVRRCPTQQELGTMIGACRETVSRMIAELSRRELVVLRGRSLKISSRFLDEVGVV